MLFESAFQGEGPLEMEVGRDLRVRRLLSDSANSCVPDGALCFEVARGTARACPACPIRGSLLDPRAPDHHLHVQREVDDRYVMVQVARLGAPVPGSPLSFVCRREVFTPLASTALDRLRHDVEADSEVVTNKLQAIQLGISMLLSQQPQAHQVEYLELMRRACDQLSDKLAPADQPPITR